MSRRLVQNFNYFTYRPAFQRLLTPGQFAMCFRQAKTKDEVERHSQYVGVLSENQFIVVGGEDAEVPRDDRRLVEAFWTRGGKLMILMKTPSVLDSSKLKQNHNKRYARLLMFRHWTDENLFLGVARHSEEVCLNLYKQERKAINEVAEGLSQLLRNMMR